MAGWHRYAGRWLAHGVQVYCCGAEERDRQIQLMLFLAVSVSS